MSEYTITTQHKLEEGDHITEDDGSKSIVKSVEFVSECCYNCEVVSMSRFQRFFYWFPDTRHNIWIKWHNWRVDRRHKRAGDE